MCKSNHKLNFIGNVFQLFLSEFWMHWILVVSFLIMGLALIYMGITEEEEKEDFDEKMKNIEHEMMSQRSRVFSGDFEDEEKSQELENMLPDNPEKEAEARKPADKQAEKNEHGVVWKIARLLCLNEAMKIIATII